MKKSWLIYVKECMCVSVCILLIGFVAKDVSSPVGKITSYKDLQLQQLASQNYSVIGYAGNDAYVEIPHMYHDVYIQTIENEVFKDSNVDTIVLPKSICFIGKQALETNSVLDIQIDNNMSETFVSMLDESVLGKQTTATLIESEYAFATINGKTFEGNYVQWNTKEDALQVELQVSKKKTYTYANGKWTPIEAEMEFIPVDNIVWYRNDSMYTNHPVLNLDTIEDKQGVYTAKQNGEVIFTLNVYFSEQKDPSAIETGRHLESIGLLIILLLVSVFGIKKLLRCGDHYG